MNSIVYFGIFVLAVYLLAPLLTRKLWMAADPVFEQADPQDPRFPERVRAFFVETARDLEPLGYMPAAYLLNPDSTPNTTCYIALFENRAAGDAAAAMALLSTPTSAVQNYAVEFSCEFANGDSLDTNNNFEPEGLALLHWMHIHRLPAMADLARIHRVHRALVARHDGIARKPLPPPGGWSESLREAVQRQLRGYADSGWMRLDSQSRRFHYTLKGAMLATWRQMPPIIQLRRWLLKRRARRLLHELNMPVDYATVDYRREYAPLANSARPISPPRESSAQAAPRSPAPPTASTCSQCGRPMVVALEAAADPPLCQLCVPDWQTGRRRPARLVPLLLAALLGSVAAGFAAFIYYRVAVYMGDETVWTALVVGLLVGGGVWLGSGRRGGRSFQCLAVLLTYMALGTASLLLSAFEVANDPEAWKEFTKITSAPVSASGPSPATSAPRSQPAVPPDSDAETSALMLLFVAVLLVFALPVLVCTQYPIAILPIGIALYQAWRINRRRDTAHSPPSGG